MDIFRFIIYLFKLVVCFGCEAKSLEHFNRVVREGLKDRIEVRQEDFFHTQLQRADVVTLYLLPEANRLLSKRLLMELPRNARVVAHDYPIPGWRPTETLRVKYDGKIHTIYLYHPHLIKRF